MQVKRPNLSTTPAKFGSNRGTLPPLSSLLSGAENSHQNTSTPINNDKILPSISTVGISGLRVAEFNKQESLLSIHGQYSGPSIPSLNYGYAYSEGRALNISEQTPSRASISDYDLSMRSSSNSSFDTSESDLSVGNVEQLVKSKKRSVSNDAKSYAFISHSPTTFPSQEPSIDNMPLARRKRRRTSPNELSVLNDEFKKGQTPNKARRIEIANKMSMSEKAVQIWFQNKRQAIRKQMNTEKEVTEFPVAPAIQDMSTPLRPIPKNHQQSFINSSSPVHNYEMRSQSTASISVQTPISKSNEYQDSTIPGLVLNEMKKKQPIFLNSNSMSSITFRLAPPKVKSLSYSTPVPVMSKVSQKLASVAMTSESKSKEHKAEDKPEEKSDKPESGKMNTKEVKHERLPLKVLDCNKSIHNAKVKKQTKDNDKDCIQNLLALRTGNWH